MDSAAQRAPRRESIPVIYRLHRWFFAACVVLGMAATLFLVVTSPQYYGPQNGVVAMVTTFAAANSALMQAHFLAGVLTVYLLPLSMLLMAWLAMPRAPWLASLAALVVFIALFPLAAFSAQDALTYDITRMGSEPILVTLAQRFNDDGVMSYYNAMFIVGTVLGPVLVGIALWRARVVPTWAAALITFGRLLVFVYPLIPGLPGVYVQIPSWGLLLVGSIGAAKAILDGNMRYTFTLAS